LKEGVDRLRRRLDALHDGDRQRWRALLGPLVLSGAGLGKGLIMAMSMSTKGKLIAGGLVALLLALGGWFGLRQGHDGGRPSPFALERAAPPPAARVVLPEGGRASGGIEGVVKDPGGRPVAGALVALARARQPGEASPPGPGPMATTDGSGRFAIAEAWTGTNQLTAAARGFRGARSRPFTLAAGQRHEVELRLGEGGITLSGQVLDEGSGPIPGAVVTAGMGYPWNSTPGVPRLDRQFVAISYDVGRYHLSLEPR
jgi:hypothetical protein